MEQMVHTRTGQQRYIFPSVGMGVLACAARLITDEMFFAAAKVLSR